MSTSSLSRRRFVQLAAATPLLTSAVGTSPAAAVSPDIAKDAMRRAAVFMDEEIAYEGAYLWSYQPDLSTVWGEMEARRTMCWVQPPGTPTVGHALLDAYHATGDRRFYEAARRTGRALVRAQLPVGGWNYIFDFAGESSLRQWYETIGANGWRLEEFQHYYTNATYDDAVTSTSAQLILRLHLEDPGDQGFKNSLERAINFIRISQFNGRIGDGGWPQRYPPVPDAITEMPWPDVLPPWLPPDARRGMEDGDYTQHVTFNDNVLGENIKFLLMCIAALGRHELGEQIHRAMNCLRRLQQHAPQAGWGLQHLWRGDGRPDGAPSGGRSYEPRALTTHTTATNIQQLFNYFLLTGDRSFLNGVPAALDWLETCRLTPQQIAENPLLGGGRTHPTYVELGTNRALFVHRFGSNINNGAYYFDYDHRNTLSHYSAGRNVNVGNLRSEYQRLMGLSQAEVNEWKARSPLTRGNPYALPRIFQPASGTTYRDLDLLELFRGATVPMAPVDANAAATIVNDLGDKDHWLSPVAEVTNPFRGPGPTTPYNGQAYMSRHVGDVYDTSPFPPGNPPAVPPYEPRTPPLVISADMFVRNISRLISYTSTSA